MRVNQHSPTLLGLPDELLVAVLTCLEWSRDLNSVTRTCRQLYSLCDPILYHRVVLSSFKITESFLSALRAQPTRAQNVQTLWTYMRPFTDEQVNKLTAGCTDSSALTFDEEIDDVDEILKSGNIKLWNGFVAPTLPALVNCRLRFLGKNDEYWHACYAWSLFVHPTLQHLTLTKANLRILRLRNPSSVQLRSRFSTTPLEILVLRDCFMFPADLRGIMAFPSSLKRLFLSDSLPLYPLSDDGSAETAEWIEALAAVRDTLRMLTIERVIVKRESSFLVMNAFRALLHLRISIYQLLGDEGLFLSLSQAGIDLEKILAPNLKILELTILDWCELPASMHLLSQIAKFRKAGQGFKGLKFVELMMSRVMCAELRDDEVSVESKLEIEKLREEVVSLAACGVNTTLQMHQ